MQRNGCYNEIAVQATCPLYGKNVPILAGTFLLTFNNRMSTEWGILLTFFLTSAKRLSIIIRHSSIICTPLTHMLKVLYKH